MIVFDKPGIENTEQTIEIAVAKAKEMGADIVLSSGSGRSAELTLDQANKVGFSGKIVVVRSASKAALKGANKMTPEMRASLESRGAVIVSAAHALSAGERGISGKFKGIYPLELMAATLRTFGQGTKVCFECSVMALDADAVSFGRPLVAMGGSSQGLDTAAVITPAYSADILETKMHEILCKPGLYE